MERNSVTNADTIMEKTAATHEEFVHLAPLTAEEKVLEKKLTRRIDALIMPLIILVYLMNYIDR